MGNYTYGNRELLVIDDEAPIIRVVRRVNNKHFGQIHEADNFDDGLAAIKNLKVPQSMILSDFHILGGIGLDLAKITYETRKQLQIGMIIMSGGADSQEKAEIESAQNQGIIAGFVSKPFTPDDVQMAVKKYYRQLGLNF